VHEYGFPIRLATFRDPSPLGDMVVYSEPQINSYEWILLKTGDQGHHSGNEISKTNYKKIENYIRNSGHFIISEQWQLPDESRLELYKSSIR
jgi:hypothetical protein